MKKINVGVILRDNPEALSKKYFYMLDSLSRNDFVITPIYPVKTEFLERILKILNKISILIFNKRIAVFQNNVVAIIQCNKIKRTLRNKNVEFIFGPFASTPISRLKTDIPIVYCSDTTFTNMINYYEKYSNLWKTSVKRGTVIEKLALEKSVFSIFSSRWAADSAINDLGIRKDKIHVLPFGANLEKVPASISYKFLGMGDSVNLLFLGVEWWRKGGDVAVKIHNILKYRGYKSKLTICGVVPPKKILDADVDVIPFIDKNDKQGQIDYEKMFLKNHFLVLPVRAECMGHVFCEASAFGLPSISTRTGGVGEVVIQGVNGYTVDFDETGRLYAEQIESIINSGEYENLSRHARELYLNKLNWDVWAEDFRTLVVDKILF